MFIGKSAGGTFGSLEQYDIYGEQRKRAANIVTFADEIKPSELSPWAYITVLSLPWLKVDEALRRLNEDRKTLAYDYELKWHELSRSKASAGKTTKARLARAWLKRLIDEHDLWKFSITGLNTERLVMAAFGDKRGEQITNSYRRFYRSSLKLHVLSMYRSFDQVIVERCYHDEEGRLQSDSWFSTHPISVLDKTTSVVFREREIRFVNSCHNKEPRHPKASHFVQLVDILGGAVRYAFEAVGRNFARDFVVEPLLPLLERLNDRSRYRNPNSVYQHVGRASISFFPSKQIDEEFVDDEFARSSSSFYIGRTIQLRKEMSGQASFDF